MTKIANINILGPILWDILTNGGLPVDPNWTDLKFSTIFYTEPELKGANSCIWDPTVRAVLDFVELHATLRVRAS